ncbi:hypothetical protein MUP46_02970 [Patescibacteria group bacterium]|nr:hypothetical protein [Patescibacteria group bacterium]
MKLIRKIINRGDLLALIFVIIFGILAARQLFSPGYFNMHDDLQVVRQVEIEKCFRDGQIPCRWVSGLGFDYGFPFFNYYPPLPYLVGEIFRILGFTFISTAKLLFISALLISGIGMYFLAKEFFGKFGAVISSIFYIWAPYHAVDVYVRGAMNEAWALGWFPFIFWTSYKLAKEKKNSLFWMIGLIASWLALLITHNVMAAMFIPLFAVWCLILFWRLKAWKKIPQFLLCGALALGLAAFFVFPALLEQKYAHTNPLISGYFYFVGHFVTLSELFISRLWGYGSSNYGPIDGMSFQIGYIHWILSVIILGVIAWRYLKNRKTDFTMVLVIFIILAGWFAVFMTHSRSTFLWLLISPLVFVQFPWRFLSITIFAFSFAAGYLTEILPKRFAVLVPATLAILLIFINWNYFKPEKMIPMTDEKYLSGAAWKFRVVWEYFLPITAKAPPTTNRKVLAEVGKGTAQITELKEGTSWATFNVNVDSDTAKLRINIFEYPGWRVFIDNKLVNQYVPENEPFGLMWVDIVKGKHVVAAHFYNTPVRKISDIASVASLLVLLGIIAIPVISSKR